MSFITGHGSAMTIISQGVVFFILVVAIVAWLYYEITISSLEDQLFRPESQSTIKPLIVPFIIILIFLGILLL